MSLRQDTYSHYHIALIYQGTLCTGLWRLSYSHLTVGNTQLLPGSTAAETGGVHHALPAIILQMHYGNRKILLHYRLQLPVKIAHYKNVLSLLPWLLERAACN